MGVVKGQDHTVSLVSNWFASFLFHINQISIPEIQLFWNLTLNIKGQGHGWGQRSRSQSSSSIQQMHLLFVSHQSDQPFLRYVQECLTLRKHIRKFRRKLGKKGVSNRIHPQSNLVRAWPGKYSYQVLLWLVEWFSLYPADKQIFVYQCHSRDLGSRSPKCHSVHFPRPILSLSQISKV